MRAKLIFVVAFAALLSACVTTEFQLYESKNNLFEGRGGTKTIVDGMEVWDNGEPPRTFKILGFIQDERPGGIIPMSQLRADIVKKARQVGGDAVIQGGSQSQIAGFVSSGTATATTYRATTTAIGTGFTMPVRRNSASFVVIKFEEPDSLAKQAPNTAEVRKYAGYWNIIFAGASSGDCSNLLIDINVQISGSCRLQASAGVYGQSFSVVGTVNGAGVATLTATTGATMAGTFIAPSAGSGSWTNGTASGTWSASRI